MINAGSPGGSTHECGFSRLECPAMKEACCMSERAGSRVGKQLEDRSVGRCATTTESEGAANPWERGIVEKELVKKDYKTVLEAWWTR